MKRISYISISAAVAILSIPACVQEKAMPESSVCCPETGLTIRSVSVTDYTSGAGTKALNDGKTVTFEAGDRIGLLLFGSSGELLGNVSYSYTADGLWNNDDNTAYSAGIVSAIAYFPYSDFSGETPTTVDGLKSWKMEQNARGGEFRDKDLLVDEFTVGSADLAIAFEHAFSLLYLSGERSFTANGSTYSYRLSLTDVSLTVGDETYVMDEVDGTYCCLMNGGVLNQDEFRYFYFVEGESCMKTVSGSCLLEPNHSYALPCVYSGWSDDSVSAGDYYCTDEGGNAVIVPGVAAALPEGLTCKGIVFYTMDSEEFGDYASENGLDPDAYAGYDGSHGLVVSLANGGSLGSAEDFSDFLLTSVGGWDSREALNGFRMTKALQDAVSAGTITSFTALDGHTEPASAVSTPWFAPSFMELAVLVRGGDGTAVSNDGLVLVNARLGKLGAAEIGTGNIPTVTFGTNEQEQNIIWFVTGSSGAEFSYSFAGTSVPGETFRPICAF